MLALGTFRFSMRTAAYQELDLSAGFNWASLKRIGREPASQWTGRDLQSIRLSGVIYPHYAGGLRQVETMRTLAGRGAPLTLTKGTLPFGRYLGRWCIQSVNEKGTTFFADGAPRRQEFSLRLQEYGEDA